MRCDELGIWISTATSLAESTQQGYAAATVCALREGRRSPQRASLTLTPQELAVAQLVCSGRTDREVATELVLSARTVSYHLGNAYTKLDVHSRTQLQAALRGPDA